MMAKIVQRHEIMIMSMASSIKLSVLLVVALQVVLW